jgi:cbb3-type cytochrome oxidase cytochrome c subunit
MKVTNIFLAVVVCSIATARAGDVTPAAIREAATKAVVVLQNSQKTWYTKESCVSCHQQVFPAMAFRAAREHGIPVDEPAALKDAQAAFRFYSDFRSGC